jgi:hypothetical protein
VNSARARSRKCENPPRECSQWRVLRAGGKVFLDNALKGFAWDKFDGLGSFDFDAFPGFGIDAFAGFAGSNFECAKSDQLDLLGFFHACFDGVNNRANCAFGFGFAGNASKAFLDGSDEFDFVHGMRFSVEEF